MGKLTLEEYMNLVVFYKEQTCSRAEFEKFMFEQSKPYLEMIVLIRKPDADIFRLALDIAQVPAQSVVYIDDNPMFVRIAEGLEIKSILHTDYKSTCAKLALLGLEVTE